jgi:hypothetical protein
MDAFDRFWQWRTSRRKIRRRFRPSYIGPSWSSPLRTEGTRAAVSQTAARTSRELTVHRTDGPLLESVMPQ